MACFRVEGVSESNHGDTTHNDVDDDEDNIYTRGEVNAKCKGIKRIDLHHLFPHIYT